MGTVAAPTSDLELYSDDALLDPYPRYQELRDLGRAVWLEAYGLYALPASPTAARRCATGRSSPPRRA